MCAMKLGQVIRRYRVTSELSLREIGKEIGIGAATLMRLEQGRDPDGQTLAKVLAWLFSDGGSSKGKR
jgi:transcriptional regulator with XRE-family HTH domain